MNKLKGLIFDFFLQSTDTSKILPFITDNTYFPC